MSSTESDASPVERTEGEDMGPTRSQRRGVKKRKATYIVMKEEKAHLNEEIKELESCLTELKETVGLAGARTVEKVAAGNAVLSSVLREQQLVVANVQAGLAASLRSPESSPLYSYVHLGTSHVSRRATLKSIRDLKMQNGKEYLEIRGRHLDLFEPFSSKDQFVDDQGHLCCCFFDVTQFPGVRSVPKAFEAARLHFRNEEISISERLGCITVRDDYEVAEGGEFVNVRLSSPDESGVKTESNHASFCQLVDAEQDDSDAPFGILVRDNVDVDDLYPYRVDEYVRKDYRGAILLTTIARKNEHQQDEVMVVMRRAAYVKIHRPPWTLPAGSQQGIVQGINAWWDLMLDTMWSVLYANHFNLTS